MMIFKIITTITKTPAFKVEREEEVSEGGTVPF